MKLSYGDVKVISELAGVNHLSGSVADPDPGFGAFLTPGSRIRIRDGKKSGSGAFLTPGSRIGIRDGKKPRSGAFLTPGSRIQDLGWEKIWIRIREGKNLDPDPG
jgi:hypothetical protein